MSEYLALVSGVFFGMFWVALATEAKDNPWSVVAIMGSLYEGLVGSPAVLWDRLEDVTREAGGGSEVLPVA
jgi:hypothetical protein